MTDIGRVAFDGYASAANGQNFMGDQIPDWDDLGDQIRHAWRSGAAAVRAAGPAPAAGPAMAVAVGDLDVIASCLVPGCWRQFRGDAAVDAFRRWYDHLTPDHPGWGEA